MNSYMQCLSAAFLPEAAIIFDVGCNINPIPAHCGVLDDFTRMSLARFYNAQIVGIEPIYWQTYEEKWGNHPRVKLVKKALADTTEKKIMFTPGAHALSTFYDRKVFEEVRKTESIPEVEVQCITFDKLLEELLIDKVDYLKIDTEGAEFAILKGAIKNLENGNISYIQLEHGGTELDAGFTPEEIANFLKSYGYSEIVKTREDALWKKLK